MSNVFPRVSEHLLNGRLNLMGSDQLSARLIIQDFTNYAYAVPVSLWVSDLYPLASDFKVGPFTPTCTRSGGVMTVKMPTMNFTVNSEVLVYGVVITKETDSTSTSPLVSIDMFDPVRLSAGLTFTYNASNSGVLRLSIT